MDDYGSNIFTTGTVSVNGTATGNIETAGDRDWFRITLTEGQLYDISLDGITLQDTYLRIYDANGFLVAENDDANQSFDSQLLFTADYTGTYFISAAAFESIFAALTGAYEISVVETTPPQYNPVDSIMWGTTLSSNIVNVYFGTAGFSADGVTSEGFNAYEVGQFQAAFDAIAAVTNLTFNIVGSASQADLRLILDTNELPAGLLGYFNPPGTFNEGVGVFNGNEWTRSVGGTLEQGGYGFVTVIHEVLHGLGLAHPHDNGGSSTVMPGVTSSDGSYGLHDLNQGVYTTMSYNSGFPDGGADNQPNFLNTFGYEMGPMALDIAALQQMYGANTTTNTGDDVYELDDFNTTGNGWMAIWDAGGTDMIRYSGDRNVVIDLRAATLLGDFGGGGYVSTASGVASGFTVANGVIIEHAIGGNGNDLLTGNEAGNGILGNGGADTILGGGGDDSISGGSGADSMVGGTGNDLYVIDDAGDVIIENAGEGVDYVYSFISLDLNATAMNVEAVELVGTANANVLGTDSDNALLGNDGSNILVGGLGEDSLYGAAGLDTLQGGAGNDTYYIADSGDQIVESAGEGDDLVISAVSFDLSVDGQNVEWLSLNGGGNLNGTGNTADNIIAGNSGDNTLIGGDGADTLFGAAGDDLLDGSDDTDRDVFLFGGVIGNDRIQGFDIGEDVVDLSNVADITDFTDLDTNHMAQVGLNTVITIGTDTITLLNIQDSALSDADFIFV